MRFGDRGGGGVNHTLINFVGEELNEVPWIIMRFPTLKFFETNVASYGIW